MKRKTRIWLLVLLLVLAAAAAVVIWKWQTIRVIHTVMTTDKETVAQELETQSEKERTMLERRDIAVTPPSAQQRDDLLKGRVSGEELKQQLGLIQAPSDAQAAPEASAPAGSAGEAGAEPPEAPVDPADRAAAIVEECVRSLYILQVDLIEQLGGYRQAALDEWTALDSSERTSARKMEIIVEGLDRCEALEAQSDAAVRGLLDSCREELSSLGASTDVIDELWESYTEEKQATKSYFLSQYT